MREKPDSGRESKDEATDQEETSGKRRLDLSVPQVAGSAVAAVVAAKLASSFGVYGTILGAGVVSAVATCGGTLFQHFFRRTGEQIRDVTVQAKPRARQVPLTDGSGAPVAQTFRSSAYTDATAHAGPGPVTTTWGRAVEPDTTSVLPAAGAAEHTTVLRVADADADRTTLLPVADADRTTLLPVTGTDADAEKTQLLGSVDATRPVPRDDATRVLRQADPAGSAVAMGPLEPPLPSDESAEGEFTEGITHRTRTRSWKRPVLAAAVVFGVAMAGITTYEIVSGEDFSGGNGTTISNSFTGRNSSPDRPSTPSTDPSEQPSGGASTGTDDGSQQGGDASKDPEGTNSQSPDNGNDSGSDSGSKGETDQDNDSGTDSGDDDGSKTDPTPTPTPTPTPSQTPSKGGDTGSGGDAQRGETATP
ncbi:hypothetical protein ABZ916_42700 [Streptomyces sp. NPDC046853]|uniref:hypothetical protein n=1 Tax=Streptomyces sp. NPDC046853 TaxID=3154920 RepID=UPI0033CDD0BF